MVTLAVGYIYIKRFACPCTVVDVDIKRTVFSWQDKDDECVLYCGSRQQKDSALIVFNTETSNKCKNVILQV